MAWFDDWLGAVNIIDWAEGIIRGAMAGDVAGHRIALPHPESDYWQTSGGRAWSLGVVPPSGICIWPGLRYNSGHILRVVIWISSVCAQVDHFSKKPRRPAALEYESLIRLEAFRGFFLPPKRRMCEKIRLGCALAY